MTEKNTFPKLVGHKLTWVDHNRGISHPAGMAYFDERYDEYFLKIDEEPTEKRYFLKPVLFEEGKTHYRMEIALKRSDGSYKGRATVGAGLEEKNQGPFVTINYGSKYKDLIMEVN